MSLIQGDSPLHRGGGTDKRGEDSAEGDDEDRERKEREREDRQVAAT